tara:strand:- start:812 stop:1558 length:747 start_codon:yes stop_codon:yes gene_type:complete
MNLSSTKPPYLTVFCPLFKGSKFIQGYMENMVEQTIFKDVKFHILDCNSPEKEVEVIEKFLGYNNIYYERLDNDPGLYEAWNICCKKADTDLVGNWNVDDRKSPWSLEALLQPFLLDENLDIAYGPTFVSEKANETWGQIKNPRIFPCNETLTWKDLIMNNSPHCMPIWKRSIHDKFGYFDTSYETAADSDMWIRAVKSGASIKKISDVVGIYYHNPQGRSTQPATLKKMLDEVHGMRKKHCPEYTVN